MAKNTHAQEVATGTSDSYTPREKSDNTAPPRIRRAELGGDHMPNRVEEGGESASAGTDSLQPSQSERMSSERENPSHQEPAPMTENPSDPTGQEDSTVILTDGNGQETETELSEEEEVLPYSEWDYRDLQAECKERGLPANGSAGELISRLEESDSASEVDDDDEFN